MTWIASHALKLSGRAPAARFERATRDVEASQSRKLAAILRANADTEYGREHGFARLRTLKDYARAVPVNTYEDLKERVQRMAHGEPRVLTAERPVMFARTSGTTGEPKLVPVTRTCQREADGMRVWLYHVLCDHPDTLRGRVISLVSPAVEGHTPSGIPFGSTSGHIYQSMPALVRKTYLIPYPVFEVDDYEAKYHVLMRLGLAHDVTFLCTANPSSIAKLQEYTQKHADELLKEVRDGTLRRDLPLPDEARAAVQAQCKPAPERAKELEACRKKRDGQLLFADVWPGLQLIGTWKGGTVGTYLSRFDEWFNPDKSRAVPVRDLGWLASEARCSIPVSDDGSAGILAVGHNVYEFVEVDQVEADPDDPGRWDFLGAHELEAPRDYYAFVTTTGGLYRYDINDIVRVEGFHHDAPVLTFLRKGRGMTNITGEKVSDGQVIEAVTGAAADAGVTVTHFRALAEVEAAHYVFQVEAEGRLSPAQGRALLEGIERRLTEQNLEYQAKRKSGRLLPPELHVMKHGWYDQGKQTQGRRLFQSKTVVLKPQEADEELSMRSQDMCLSKVQLAPATRSAK